MLLRVLDSHQPLASSFNVDPLEVSFFQLGVGDYFAHGFVHEKIVPFGIAAQAQQGVYEITCRGETARVSKDEIFLTPPNVPLRIVHHHRDGGFFSHWVHFSFTLYQSIEVSSLLDLPLAVRGEYGRALGVIIGQLRAMAAEDQVDDGSLKMLARAARVRELVWQMFAIICELAQPRPGALQILETGKRLRPVLQHLNAHLEKPITVPQLAQLAGMSASRLFAYFRSRLDCTPMAYVSQLRLKKAAALLSQISQPSIKEVAAATGFATASHLSREFKRRYGVSPRVFRERETTRNWTAPGFADTR